MKSKLLIVSLFFCVSPFLYSMEPELSFVLQSQENSDVVRNIPLAIAESIPRMIHRSSPQSLVMKFPSSDQEDLKILGKYIKCYHQMKQEELQHDNRIEKLLYSKAKKMDTDRLVRLTHNAYLLFPAGKDTAPQGLLNPLVEQVLSGKIKSVFGVGLPGIMGTIVHNKLREVDNNRQKTQALLERQSEDNTSVITRLFAPYSISLDQSVMLPSPCKSLKEICSGKSAYISYPYVGKDIIIGVTYNWNQEKILTVYRGNNMQSFTSPKQIFYGDVGTVFVNHDESIIACSYNDVTADCNKGLFVVDKDGKTITIPGEKNSLDRQFYCFDGENNIYGFDAEDKVFILSGPDYGQQTVVGNCYGIRGMLYNKTLDQLIAWTNSFCFCFSKRSKDDKFVAFQSWNVPFPLGIIKNIIINPSGTQLCVRLLCNYNGIERYRYNFIDLNTGKGCGEFYPDVCPKSESFSPDGNLLIVNFTDEHGKDMYRFYDVLSLAFWDKPAQDKVHALGIGKSIEVDQGMLSADVKCVTLVNDEMCDAFKSVIGKEFDPFTVNSLAITQALLSQSVGDCPLDVQIICVARPEVIQSTIANSYSWRLVMRDFLQTIREYRYYCGVALIAALCLYNAR